MARRTAERDSEKDVDDDADADAEEDKSASKFADRWSPAIASSGYTGVPTLLLAHYADAGLSAVQAMFLVHLLSFYRKPKDQPYPRYQLVADMMGFTKTYVAGMARKLERSGWIRRNPRPKSRDRNQSNKFDLQPLVNRLDEIAAAKNEKKALKALLDKYKSQMATAADSQGPRTPKKAK